jgi:hypothetical protein
MAFILPNGVWHGQRAIAWGVYLLLLAGFVTYSIIAVMAAFKARDDPPTQFKLSKTSFKFPIITVCGAADENTVFNWSTTDTGCGFSICKQCSFHDSTADTDTDCGAVPFNLDGTSCMQYNTARVGTLRKTL